MSRYSGKPFLRLLECFVLHSIGELSKDQQRVLESMEPKLQEVYKMNGNWIEIVESQMDFPKTFSSKIYDLWQKNIASTGRNSVLSSEEFAVSFVDANYPQIFQND